MQRYYCKEQQKRGESRRNAKRARKYLDILTKQGLIVYDANDHTYRLTAKGNEVLQLNQQLADYLPPVKEMIRKYSCFMEVPFFDTNVNEDTKVVETAIQRLEERVSPCDKLLRHMGKRTIWFSSEQAQEESSQNIYCLDKIVTSELSMLHLIGCIEKELMAFVANEYPQFTSSKVFGMQCFFTSDD